MGMVYWLLIAGVIAVGGVVTGIVMKKRENRDAPIAFGVGGVAIVALIVTFLIAGITTIDPKHVGVQTEFGKPVDTLDNGLHLVAPWSDVTEFDGTIQSMSLAGKEGDDNRVTVRLSDQSTAWVDVVLQWQINADDKEGVKKLFENYRDPVKVDENFVEKQLRSAVNDAFGTYDPTAGIGNDERKQRAVSEYGGDALKLLQNRISTQGIKLISLTLPAIEYDAPTQQRIDNLRGLAAEKNAADLRKEIAEKTAEANNALAAGAKDPGTLYQLCLTLTEKMLNEGKTLPPAWNCNTSNVTPVLPVK